MVNLKRISSDMIQIAEMTEFKIMAVSFTASLILMFVVFPALYLSSFDVCLLDKLVTGISFVSASLGIIFFSLTCYKIGFQQNDYDLNKLISFVKTSFKSYPKWMYPILLISLILSSMTLLSFLIFGFGFLYWGVYLLVH